MAADDVSIDDSASQLPDVPQETLDTIEAVLSGSPEGSQSDGVETAAEVAMPAKPADPPRSMSARRAAAKEQQEELDEEAQLAEQAKAAEEAEAEAQESEEGETEGEEQVDEDAEPSAAEIDPVLKDIALEYGWTEERLNELGAKDPELLNETLSQLAAAYANLSRGIVSGTQAITPAPQTPAAQPALPNTLDHLYQNLQQFAEANGDELVEKFIKPLYQEVVAPVRQMMAEAQATMQQAVASEANTVFEKLSEKNAEIYGKGQTTTPAQLHARSQVAQIADQLRAGAKLQGRELSVTNALNRAHLIVNQDRLAAAARQQVQEQVQKRSRQITAKPTQRNNPAQTLNRKSDVMAAEAYERRAAELGIEI